MQYFYLLLYPLFLLHVYVLNPKLRREIEEKLDREKADAVLMEKLEETYGG